jgi:hypothetical protein
VYTPPEFLGDTSRYGQDIYSRMAAACISVPSGCEITIINVDQMPLVDGYDRHDRDHHFTRSRTGEPLKIETMGVEGYGSMYIYAARSTSTCRNEEKAGYEDKLQKRVDTIRQVVKRWMQLLLDEEGLGNELECRWEMIVFKSLAEYGNEWDMVKMTK